MNGRLADNPLSNASLDVLYGSYERLINAIGATTQVLSQYGLLQADDPINGPVLDAFALAAKQGRRSTK